MQRFLRQLKALATANPADPELLEPAPALPEGLRKLYGLTPSPAALKADQAAAAGIRGAAAPLPFLEQIQRSFGRHDVGRVRAHQGEEAAAASRALGAEAYAAGEDVAFGGAPTLHTAAHEAAHVVQQRRGVQLKGGIGEANDPYERHADAVADLVVQGRSAEAALDAVASASGASTSSAVQRKIVVDDAKKEWANAEEAFKELAAQFKVEPRILRMALETLDRANARFPKMADLEGLLRGAGEILDTQVDANDWAVLHRMKSNSFGKFMSTKGLEESSAKVDYEAKDGKYDPSKFGTGGHSWDGNMRWLDKMVKERSRAVLTQIPVTSDVLMRKSEGKRKHYNAYVREIAYLLLQKFVPFVADDHALYMVDLDLDAFKEQPLLVKLLTDGKRVDSLTLQRIAEDDPDLSRGQALNALNAAGIPTKADSGNEIETKPEAASQSEKPTIDTKPEKLEVKAETKVEGPTTLWSTEKPEAVVPRIDPEAEAKLRAEQAIAAERRQKLIALGRKILVTELKLPQKGWNKAGSLKRLHGEAKAAGLIDDDMSQNKFRDDVVLKLLPEIYAEGDPLISALAVDHQDTKQELEINQ